MKKIQLDLTDEKQAAQSRNKTAITGVSVMNIILIIAYYVEVLKGGRTLGSYAVVAAGCILPSVLSIVVFLKKKESKAVRYITSIGFALLYAYILATTTSNLAFSYVIVIFVILAVYVDMQLSIILGVYAVLINIVLAVNKALTVGLTPIDITETEIMIACLVLTCVFTIMAHSKISQINEANISKADKEMKKTEELLKTILKVGDAIVLEVDKAAAESDQLKRSISVTKSAMEELTGGANDAVSAILVQQKNTEEINIRIDGVEQVTEAIMENIGQAEGNLANGQEVMNNLLHQVQVSEESSREVEKEMKELQGYADKMQGIMALISNVASQTSLLALNASIEAARAGEAGRGFAVVASEISSLAGQTSNATGDINELIENIAKSLKEVADSVNGLLESNQKQNHYVNDSADSFDKIHTSTHNIFIQADSLKGMVEAVSSSNKLIIESIENVSAVTEEVTAGANETLEGSKINMERVDTLVQVMDGLNRNAQELCAAKTD